MDIMQFCEKAGKSLALRMGDTATVNIEKVLKNNGVTLHGVSVMEKGCNIAVNIYLDDLYLQYIQGKQFGGIVEEVYRVWQENRKQEKADMGFFLDYGQVKNRVCYKVIGLESNMELLERVPHVPFLDMAAVFYCDVPEAETGMAATVLIRNSHLEMWGITRKELYGDAKRNTPGIRPPRLQPVREILQELAGEAEGGIADLMLGDMPAMYVLGNGNRMFGAAAMLYEGILEDVSEILGDGFLLLPSSIHEVILVPAGDAEMCGEMVHSINAAQVPEEEILTNSVYRFSRENKKLEKVL